MGDIARQFARGADEAKGRASGGGSFAEYALLSDPQKEELCRTLLSEFGVSSIARVSQDGEMIHSCCLPFGLHRHGDVNPSASLNYKRLTYNCLGCGNSGGLLWFIAVCRGTGAHDARGWLANYTGVGSADSKGSLGKLLEFFDAIYTPKRDNRTPIPKFSTKVLDSWRYIHPYMTEIRHVPEDTLIRFNVGWNPETNRIVIPHFWKGDLVGWQTRRLVDDGSPKYHSSPDFPKRETIYNHSPDGSVIVVESALSVLSKFHVTPNMQAVFGAEVPDRQCGLLTSHPKVILFFDNDEAGWKATGTVADRLIAYTDVRVVENPYNADAADLDADTYQELVDSAIPYSIWRKPKELQPWQIS